MGVQRPTSAVSPAPRAAAIAPRRSVDQIREIIAVRQSWHSPSASASPSRHGCRQRLAADLPHRAGRSGEHQQRRPDRSSGPRWYGDLALTGSPTCGRSGRLTAAAQSGLDVPEVTDLPRGVTGKPVYQVGRKVTATFTFSAEQAAAQAGEKLPPPPAGLAGSQVRLVAGPGVAQVGSSFAGVPALVVGRAVAPSARLEVHRGGRPASPTAPSVVPSWWPPAVVRSRSAAST